MPKFIIKSGKYRGKTLKLPERDVVLGRDPDCDIRVPDGDISRKHCRLLIKKGKLYVQDLQSRNGTYVNDQLIETETPLQPGDQLRVGPMLFELAGTKKTIKKPSNLEPDQAAPLSDDDITTWLTEAESEPESEPSTSDTTIISGSAAPSASPPAPKEKKEYHSIAEEAADIIKKHWAKVAREQEEG